MPLRRAAVVGPLPLPHDDEEALMMTLDGYAISVNEAYESFCRAGFTPDRALYLTGQWMVASMMIHQAHPNG